VRSVLGRIGNTCIPRNPDRAFARRLGTCLPAPHSMIVRWRRGVASCVHVV